MQNFEKGTQKMNQFATSKPTSKTNIEVGDKGNSTALSVIIKYVGVLPNVLVRTLMDPDAP
jgi:hypothetical protein